MRKLIFFILPLLAGAVCLAAGQDAPSPQTAGRLRAKADSALAYCRAKGMNTDFCLLADMGVHSGRKRMWVWDFRKGAAALSSLCCHGCGQGGTGAKPVFSNVPGSNCTSLGKYRLGARSWSNWGIHVHYKMHGLEPTNDKAFERIVVLHSFSPVPDVEIHPFHLPMGWSLGCPVISDSAMAAVDSMMQKSAKPVLLWIYY